MTNESLELQTVADFLVAGMNMPPVDFPPTDLSHPVHCALSGQMVTRVYPLWSVVPSAAGEYLESFHAMTGSYLSENAARAIKGCWNMGSVLIFDDGVGHHPLISRVSAVQQGRACWSALVRDVWQTRRGQRMVCILTTDTKPRLWTKASVGVLSNNASVYIHDPDMTTSGSFRIDWEVMLRYLDRIEELYKFFVKPIIYAHHGPGKGIRNWLYGNTARFYLRDLMQRDIIAGRFPPRIVERAHAHVKLHEVLETGDYTSDLFVVPSYCMMDDYAVQVTKSIEGLTHGMLLHECDNGSHEYVWLTKTLDVRMAEEI